MNGFDTRLLSRVEDAGLNASACPQQHWLDGWLVRTSPGKAKRARCVNAVTPGRLALPEKLTLAGALFTAAGLPMVVRITPFSQPADLDDLLAAHGMQRFDDTRVMVADLAGVPDRPLPTGLWIEPAGAERYAEIVGALRASPPAQRAAHAERVARSPVPYRGFLLRDPDGGILACAQTAAEHDVVGLYDVHTAAAARNRGLASALCAHLLSDARNGGARTGYLQVDAGNAPARAVYHRLGFRDGYAYHYRADDPSAA